MAKLLRSQSEPIPKTCKIARNDVCAPAWKIALLANSCPAQRPWLQEGITLRIEAPWCSRLRLLPAASSGLTPTLIDAEESAILLPIVRHLALCARRRCRGSLSVAPRHTLRRRLSPATAVVDTGVLIDAEVSAIPSVGLCNLALSIWRPRSRSRSGSRSGCRLRRHGRRRWRGQRRTVPRRDPNVSAMQPELLSLLTVPTETDESVVARKVIWKLHPVSQEAALSVMSIACSRLAFCLATIATSRHAVVRIAMEPRRCVHATHAGLTTRMHIALLAWNIIAGQDAPLEACLQRIVVSLVGGVVRVDKLRGDAFIRAQTVGVRTAMISGIGHAPLNIDDISSCVSGCYLGSPAVFRLVPIR